MKKLLFNFKINTQLIIHLIFRSVFKFYFHKINNPNGVWLFVEKHVSNWQPDTATKKNQPFLCFNLKFNFEQKLFLMLSNYESTWNYVHSTSRHNCMRPSKCKPNMYNIYAPRVITAGSTARTFSCFLLLFNYIIEIEKLKCEYIIITIKNSFCDVFTTPCRCDAMRRVS